MTDTRPCKGAQSCIMQHMRNGAIILAVLLTATPTLAAAEARSEIDVQFCQTDLNDQDKHLPVKPEFYQPKKQRLPLKQCEKLPLTHEKYADTAHCFLRIDGKVVINRTCHIYISPQLREWTMKGVATVLMRDYFIKDDPSKRLYYADFERHGRSLDYGRVEVDRRNRPERICFGNKRFRWCVSQPYLICDPEQVKGEQAN
jgi:hypothetical protein